MIFSSYHADFDIPALQTEPKEPVWLWSYVITVIMCYISVFLKGVSGN